MNDVRLNVSVSTGDSLRDIENLNKAIDDVKNKSKNVGKGADNLGGNSGIGETNDTTKSTNSSLAGIFDSLEKNLKASNQTNRDLIKALRDVMQKNELEKDIPTTPVSKEPTKPTEIIPPPDTTKKEPPKPDKAIPAELIGAITGGILSLRRMANQGARESRQLESQSLDIFSRTGAYGSNFNQGRVDAHRIGVPYGYDMQTTMRTQDVLMASGGFKDLNTLQSDTSNLLELSKVYGFSPDMAAETYGKATRSGTFDLGEGQVFANLIASSIRSNSMTGREDEQVQSLTAIVDILTDGFPNVTQENYKAIAGLQSGLSSINENLKGQRGAELLAKGSNLFNPNDPMFLRFMGYGGELGYGLEAQTQAISLAEKGFTNRESVDAFANSMETHMGGMDSLQTLHLVRQYTGTTLAESQVLIDLIKNRDYNAINEQLGQEDIGEKSSYIQDSKALKQEQYEINTQNAVINVGNAVNSLTSPFKGAYNSLPTPVQAGLSVGSSVGRGALAGVGTITLGKTLLGGGTLSKIGTGLAASGSKIGTAVAGSKIGTAIAGSSGVLGTYAPHIGAGLQGIESIRDFSQGDTKGGVSALGGAAGTFGGIKAGAALGTVIAGPGVGTVIGGAVGGLSGSGLGRMVGGGLYDFVSGEPAKASSQNRLTRETDILTTKEKLLTKEEEVFDKVLGFARLDSNSLNNTRNRKSEESETQQALKELMGDNAYEYFRENQQERIANISSTPANGKKAEQGDYLGKASAKYESPSGGHISSGKGDHGGKSYGIPQFSSKMGSADSFRKNAIDNSEFAKYFEGAGKAGTSSFDKAWTNAYNANPSGFTNLQTSYNYKNAVEPFINRVKKEKGVDLTQSRALQEMAYSIATQHGSAGTYALGNINSSMNEKELINYVYDYKRNNVDTHFRSSSKSMKDGIRNNRIPNEKKDMLALLGQDPIIPSYAVGTRQVDKDKVAFLHKDETVLNKHDAKDYREGKTNNQAAVPINLNISLSATDGVSPQLINLVKNAVNQAIQQSSKEKNIPLNKSYVRVPN